jgi:hypothetical protein
MKQTLRFQRVLIVLVPLALSLGLVAQVGPPGAGIPPGFGVGHLIQQPGPEHQRLAKFVGTWQAEVNYYYGQKDPVMKTAGTEVCALASEGRWLSTRFDETPDKAGKGEEYQGLGILGWDPNKKRYVSTWTDSVVPEMLNLEGDSSADGNTFTLTGQMVNPLQPGQPAKLQFVMEFSEKGTRTLTVRSNDLLFMKAEYHLKKKR